MKKWIVENFGWISATVYVVVCGIIIWNPAPDDPVLRAACGTGDEPCIREWVSALSGWAAVIAAYLTIRTMNAQTAEANRHQRENLELEIMGRLTLVKRTYAHTKTVIGFSLQQKIIEIKDMCDQFRPYYGIELFHLFEEQIGPRSVNSADDLLPEHYKDLDKWAGKLDFANQHLDEKTQTVVLNELLNSVKHICQSAKSIQRDCLRFRGKWGMRIGESS